MRGINLCFGGNGGKVIYQRNLIFLNLKDLNDRRYSTSENHIYVMSLGDSHISVGEKMKLKIAFAQALLLLLHF